MNHYDIYRDQLAITFPSFGHALWEPAPEGLYGPVEVGDVGYVREGRFFRLFNALLPADHESHKDTNLPEYHEPLIPNIPNHIFGGTRKPDHYCSAGVNAEPAKPDYLSQGPPEFTEASFSCPRRRGGALLSLPVDTQRQDTRARRDFGKWMLKHIDCWFAFARGLGLEIERMEDIILVTGCDRTKSWANIAFLEGQAQKMAVFGFKVIQGHDIGIYWQFLHGNRQGAVCNWGPEGQNLREDQCVFIRGFRVRRILGMRQLKGAAGPEPSLDGDRGDDELGKELISIPTSTKYLDPLYVLLDHVVERAPDCDMVLIHDDDLLRIGQFHDGNGTLQSDSLMAYLQRTQPEIQQIPCEKDCPSNERNTVAMFSTEFQEWGPTPPLGIPRVIHDSVLTVTSTLYKLVSVERHRMILAAVVFVEAALLKYIGGSGKDVLYAIIFTLLGRLVWPVWSSLKRLHRGLDEVFARVDALQQSIKSLESAPDVRPPIPILTRAEPGIPPCFPREDTSEPIVDPAVYECPVGPPVVTNEHPQPYDTSPPEPFETLIVVESPHPTPPPAALLPDSGTGASGFTARPASTPELVFSRWLSALREIKQRIQQFTGGRIERISHLDRSEPSIFLSHRRWGVRLLMSAASLSPADFASPVGYLGPIESTPYYPTGDIRGDRSIAFTIVLDCLDELEVDLCGNDVRIPTKLFKLAQALSDLGLHEYALTTSGFALDALEQRLYLAAPNTSRLLVASVLSLRANILCDLKRNDFAKATADRAVTLCWEHQSSRGDPVPELAYSLLNYAVVLGSIGFEDESAAVAFELCADDSLSDMKDISALCKLCLSNTRIGAEDELALSIAEEAIDLTRSSSDANSQTVLAGALLNKSKILSSRRLNNTACLFSAEAVTVLHTMATERPMFTLFLAHALDTYAHHLSEANRKAESYSIRQDAVEHWQTLKTSVGGAVARPLARSIFELAKFRHRGSDRSALLEEFRIAESAVDMFRQVEPLDAPGLGDALYLYADRMLEQDNGREAATYAEESVHYFLEASSIDPKYALDLILSLSLASSCLVYTERASDALEYAKQAVQVQHGRKGVDDERYNAHLSKLLMDVMFRAKEMGKQEEAFSWFQELQAFGELGGECDYPLHDNSQDKDDEFKKQTSYWMDTNPSGKGKEVSPSPEAGSSTSRVDKGKAKGVDPPFDSSTLRHRLADEEIVTLGAVAAAAAQRRLGGIESTGPQQGFAGYSGNDLLNGLQRVGSIGSPSSMSSRVGRRTLGGSGIPSSAMGGLDIRDDRRGRGSAARVAPRVTFTFANDHEDMGCDTQSDGDRTN